MDPTNASPPAKVLELYEQSADSYAEMMDAEIDQPVYAETLGRLAERLVGVDGPIVDTSCGTGHMLRRYRDRFDPERALIGIDLSPRMVSLARARLGSNADVFAADMRDLQQIQAGGAAAVVSFFALHHLSPGEVAPTLEEWGRILQPRGQLVLATWEGAGAIDYGEASDVVALRYAKQDIAAWAEAAGFVVDRCVVEPVEDMAMDAIYLEGMRDGRGYP